ncbi:uncharacterized protein L969DRAFT_94812 [Mixia osmundae IAM 14324]|uniref:Caspase family p20 domain-containing protein n=1 Tax=Mixia osmundae (strain CBS 9802 / IAM 14324 / JCM 22182 / KY 12970) TaxID=764103 RepID=G7E4B5_MIXOS|nr:uncharacterized protein L969DRAFT_94812 [Mixia osmundae IAM 14324]KEI39772.1 hypothetical protein L969DRAFT_94812 [Mixia osmundae IAM 14324]GAA97675.1 hypothetical protein E5Q_04353 [Mixia osmundae IAM 14324]
MLQLSTYSTSSSLMIPTMFKHCRYELTPSSHLGILSVHWKTLASWSPCSKQKSVSRAQHSSELMNETKYDFHNPPSEEPVEVERHIALTEHDEDGEANIAAMLAERVHHTIAPAPPSDSTLDSEAEWKPTGPDLLALLPAECLSMILRLAIDEAMSIKESNRRMGSLLLTCRRFHDILMADTTFWQALSFEGLDRRARQRKTASWQTHLRHKTLLHLDLGTLLDANSPLRGHSLCTFAGNALASLTCGDVKRTRDLISHVAPTLLRLELEVGRIRHSLVEFLSYFPNARRVILKHSYSLDAHALKLPVHKAVRSDIHPIRELSITNVTLESAFAGEDLPVNAVYFQSLRRLHLRLIRVDPLATLPDWLPRGDAGIFQNLLELDIDSEREGETVRYDLDLAHLANLEVARVGRHTVTSLPATLKVFSHRPVKKRKPPLDLLVQCLNLEEIDLPTGNLSGSDLAQLLASGKIQLKCLTIGPSTTFDDHGIEALAKSCKRLSRLVVSGCRKLTHQPLISLVQACRDKSGKASLDLCLDNCSKLDPEAVRWLKTSVTGRFSHTIDQKQRRRVPLQPSP